MLRRGRFWITVLLPIAFLACSSTPAFKEPPASSFTSGAHQLKIGDAQASLQGASVTKDFFGGSDVQPMLGRFFIDGDFAAPGPSPVVLSNQLWTEGLHSSPAAVGQTIQIDGQAFVVVGVASKGFDFPRGARFWMAKKS